MTMKFLRFLLATVLAVATAGAADIMEMSPVNSPG